MRLDVVDHASHVCNIDYVHANLVKPQGLGPKILQGYNRNMPIAKAPPSKSLRKVVCAAKPVELAVALALCSVGVDVVACVVDLVVVDTMLSE